MSYTVTIPILLGPSKAGLTLQAQLVNPTTGADVGAAITSGFVESGLGNYSWSNTFAETDRYIIEIQNNADDSLLAVTAVNPDAIKPVTDKLDDTLEDDGGTYRFTTNALEQAPSGGGSSLTGANSVTITITDGTDPLETVRVRVTKGAQTEVKTTDANGEVSFSLDNGTWEVRATLAGYTMAAQSLVVDGVETPTYAMTALSYDANPDPALVNGEYTVLINGVGTSGQSVYLELKEAPTTGDNAVGVAAIDKRTLTSGDDGVTEIDNLIKGAKYGLRIGTAGRQWVFLVPADADDSEARVRINSFVGENT